MNKKTITFFFFVLMVVVVYAQQPKQTEKTKPDSVIPSKGNIDQQLENIKEKKNTTYKDSVDNEPKMSTRIDTTLFNRYGDLLNDDTAYNKKYPLWIPAAEVIGVLGVTWAFDRYALNADYAHIGMSTWKKNIREGWEWDTDKFGINFIGHPYSGALSYSAGRSFGHSYLTSFGLAVFGSLGWEYFGENTRPSYNDIINTPVSGAFLGEVLYRISSNILDDRTRGFHRVVREVAAGLVDPVRGVNRLLQGKAFRVTNKEVYQEEPLNISIAGGIQQRNSEVGVFTNNGITNPVINLQLDYGNAFEQRRRKPFDFFRLRVDLSLKYGRKMIDNVGGYGLLAGKNIGSSGNLFGLFQHYDYWDNYSFEMGALGLGPGLITRLPFEALGMKNNLYSNFHLGIIPLAGKNMDQGVDSLTKERDYNFGWGSEIKLEVTLNLGEFFTLTAPVYYYYVHTYTGQAEDAFLGIFKPKLYFTVFRNIKLGIEHTVQYDDSFRNVSGERHATRTEQKAFVLIYLEDKQRKGRYN